MLKEIKLFAFLCAVCFFAGCATTQTNTGERIADANAAFLTKDASAEELFRVLISSDGYTVVQMKNESTIKRTPDEGGDKYICSEFGKLNKIDEMRDGVMSVWLFPDTGRLMKIRTQKPTFLVEVDQLLTEDIQRWNFTFPKRIVDPTKFDIRYRIVLKKTMSDSDIIKEVRDQMREGH